MIINKIDNNIGNNIANRLLAKIRSARRCFPLSSQQDTSEVRTCQRNVARNRDHIHSAFPFLLIITIFDQKSNKAYRPPLGTDTLSTGISRISIIIKIYGIMGAHYRSSLS